jgi:hypothetical protein
MGKKIKIRLNEQDLSNLIVKSIIDSLSKGIGKSSDSNNVGNSKFTKDNKKIDFKSSGEFTPLDLNTSDGYNAYKQIADKFISSRSSNLLGINGNMMADAAKNAFNNY